MPGLLRRLAWAGARSDGDRPLPAPDGARMNIIDCAVSTMDSLGALGVALLIFLENLFPPIPSEVILPLAGVIAAGPEGSYLAMLLASVAGSVAGAWLLYGLGRLLGPKRLRRLFIRLPLIDVDYFERTVEWMERHGYKSVIIGRMVHAMITLDFLPACPYAHLDWLY